MRIKLVSPVIKNAAQEAEDKGVKDELEWITLTHLNDACFNECMSSIEYETDSHDIVTHLSKNVAQSAVGHLDLSVFSVQDISLAPGNLYMDVTIKD